MTAFKKLTSIFLLLLIVLTGFVGAPHQVNAAGDKVVITLDAGHGGPSDPGACYGRFSEKTLTLELAYKIKAILEATGNFTVHMTRTGDVALTKAQRLMIANSHNSDFLLSIHFDGNNNPSVNGVTVYTSVVPEYSPTSLASSIAGALSSVGFKNNGIRQNSDPECFWNSNKQWDVYDASVGINADYYGVISWGCKFGFPAIIVEHGYLSNPNDASFITSEGTLDKMAQAEAGALISYFTGHTHTYGETVVDYPSNCAIQGKSSQHCTVCRHRINVTTLPADPDNHYYYSDAIVSHKVSCDTEESVTYKCRISENFIEKGLACEDHTLTDVLKPKTEHNYVVTYHVPVAHATDGVTRYSCTNCASNYTETVKAEGHNWVVMHTTQPTCETDGTVTYICPTCQEKYSDPIAATGHDYVRLNLIKEPTCTEKGSEELLCNTCGTTTQRELDALGHLRQVLSHVESSCSVQGYDNCFCSRCSLEYTELSDKPEHSFQLKEESAFSCTTDEKKIFVCTLCGEEKTEVTKTAAHTFSVTEEVFPSCETEGYTVSTCSVCGQTKKDSVAPTGHSWNSPVPIKNATAFTNGVSRTVCCFNEEHSYEEPIPSKFNSDLTFRKEALFVAASLALSTLTTLSFLILTLTAQKKKHISGAVKKVP